MNSPTPEEEQRLIQSMLRDLEVVGGRDLVIRLLSNFTERLSSLLGGDEGPNSLSPPEAHALAGVAGMLGFARLAAVSRSAMDQDDTQATANLRTAALDALGTAATVLCRLKYS